MKNLCAISKGQRHTLSPPDFFTSPDECFALVHTDITVPHILCEGHNSFGDRLTAKMTNLTYNSAQNQRLIYVPKLLLTYTDIFVRNIAKYKHIADTLQKTLQDPQKTHYFFILLIFCFLFYLIYLSIIFYFILR